MCVVCCHTAACCQQLELIHELVCWGYQVFSRPMSWGTQSPFPTLAGEHLILSGADPDLAWVAFNTLHSEAQSISSQGNASMFNLTVWSNLVCVA